MTSLNYEWRTLSLKHDILGAAPVYIDMLQKWHKYPSLVSENTLKKIIHRYEQLWLPLMMEWPNVDLEPPLDIHWVWHVHMLHPRQYVNYCLDKYKKVLPHKIRLSDSEEKFAVDRTRLIWQDKYKNEPYELDLQSYSSGTYHLQGKEMNCVLQAARKVMDFTHQVSLPHYRDSNFLFQALCRYKKYLVLRKQRPQLAMAVPVDVLLMWRIHAMFPGSYYHEALKPCSLFTQPPGTDHDGQCLAPDGYTDSAWGVLYHDPLLVPGSAYRGSPSYDLLRELPRNRDWEPVVDHCELNIDELSISELWSRDKNLVVVVRLLGNTSFSSKEILRQQTQLNKVMRAELSTAGLVSFKFDTKQNRGVEFDIYAIRTRCCGESEIHLNTMQFNPREPFGNSVFTSRDFLYQVPKVSNIDPKVSFRCRLRAAMPDPHVLSLNRAPFTPVKELPPDLLSFVHRLPAWRSGVEGTKIEGNDTSFSHARHSLKSRDGNMDFGVDVIKQYSLDLGAVMVHDNNDHLVALAHTIGDETLASPNQLTEMCPVSFEPGDDELAMSISNSSGEWAVCKGRWRNHNGEGGVNLKVFYLQSNSNLEFDIRDDELHTIEFSDITIDMPTGRVTIDSRSQSMAENIALAFCVGIMYVTCQMRATLLATSRQNSVGNLSALNGSVRSVKSTKSANGMGLDLESSMNSSKTTSKFTARRRNRKKNRQRKMSASYTYLLASGLLIDLTLHGSTRKENDTPSRASLASIHLLYKQTQEDQSDAKNNNYHHQTAANQNVHYIPNGYEGHNVDIAPVHSPSDVTKTSTYRNYPSQVTSLSGIIQDDDRYMDVKL